MALPNRHGVTGGNAVAHIDITLSYNDADQVASISRYQDDELTVTADYTYNADGLLVGLVYHQGDAVLTQYTFSGVAWDATASVGPTAPTGQSMLPVHETSEIAEAIAGSSSSSNLLTTVTSSDGTVTYTYDAIGQLLSATYSNESIADETYTYDANGNRTSATGSASVVGTDNQLLSDGTYRYSYDAEGNRIAKFIDTDADGLLDEGDTNITQYTWDARNRLMEVTSYATYGGSASQVVDYFYDAENRWIAETIDADGDGQIDRTLGFVYDGDQIALQFERARESATGSASALTDTDLSHRYLWQANAVDQLLADEALLSATGSASGGEGGSDGYDLSTPGDVLFALTDHLGTVRDLAAYDNGVTSIANHRVYDSFGNLKSETNAAVDCLFGFTGRAYDENSGLQNNLNRWYDSKTGSWVSEDPIGFLGQDANTSRYVGNSPTNVTDPSGLSEASEAANRAADVLITKLRNSVISAINDKIGGDWTVSQNGLTYTKKCWDTDHNSTTLKITVDTKGNIASAVVTFSGKTRGEITCTPAGLNRNGALLSKIHGWIEGKDSKNNTAKVTFDIPADGKVTITANGKTVVGGLPIFGELQQNGKSTRGSIGTRFKATVFGQVVNGNAGAQYNNGKWSAAITLNVNGIFTITINSKGQAEGQIGLVLQF